MRHLLFDYNFTGHLFFHRPASIIRERGLFGKKARTLEMLRAQQDSIRVADSLKRVENRLRSH